MVKRQILRSWSWCLPVLILLVGMRGVAASGLKAGERLDYSIHYRGIFSGFMEMTIAQAELKIQHQDQLSDESQGYLASFNLTTEPYATAEALYPVRFHYRSWFDADRQRPLLVSELTRTDELNEELIWFDQDNRQGYRYAKSKQPTATELPPAGILKLAGIAQESRPFLQRSHKKSLADEEVREYLSLLYRLRVLPLVAGEEFELPIFNGRQIKRYRIEVVRERLQRGGWDLPALKLSLYELKKGKRKTGRNHNLWLSDDPQRLPLRFYTERAFGAFEGILETGRPRHSVKSEISEATKRSLEEYLLF